MDRKEAEKLANILAEACNLSGRIGEIRKVAGDCITTALTKLARQDDLPGVTESILVGCITMQVELALCLYLKDKKDLEAARETLDRMKSQILNNLSNHRGFK